MADPLDDIPTFDLTAASLRMDAGDVVTWSQVLADKLEQALPDRTRVTRTGGGLLRRRGGERRVRELVVELQETSYGLTLEGDRVQTVRQKRVGGISIKREALEPDAWITELSEALRREAQTSARAREALQRLLG